MKPWIRIIGDVHGLTNQYLGLIKKPSYSVQLGDHGFNYDHLKNVDASRHHILGGNYDNMESLPQQPHYLGDFGTSILGGVDLFYIRGGRSIDKEMRILNVSWWQEEELNYMQGVECLKEYQKTKPRLVISHECPASVLSVVANRSFGNIPPSYTSMLLHQCLEIHRPAIWIFGHYHKSFRFTLESTLYVALDELAFVDIDKDGRIGNVQRK